jgi:hypothetical protein
LPVVVELPSVATVAEIVVEVGGAPGIVVVDPPLSVVTVEIVEVVTAGDDVVGPLGVVVVGSPVVVGVMLVDTTTGIVEVVVEAGTEEVVVDANVVVVVEALGAAHPLSKTAMPSDVQFLPPYISFGPKSNGGMMSPHFVCFGMAG